MIKYFKSSGNTKKNTYIIFAHRKYRLGNIFFQQLGCLDGPSISHENEGWQPQLMDIKNSKNAEQKDFITSNIFHIHSYFKNAIPLPPGKPFVYPSKYNTRGSFLQESCILMFSVANSQAKITPFRCILPVTEVVVLCIICLQPWDITRRVCFLESTACVMGRSYGKNFS